MDAFLADGPAIPHLGAMIERLRSLLRGGDVRVATGPRDETALAVAALLVEAARMDETFDEAERATIERLLGVKFGLDPAAVRQLVAMAEAETARSAQYFPFTRRINAALDAEGKIRLIEMMWEVAYADGALDHHEDGLLRQIAGLIHVSDRERGLARQRVLGQRNAGGDDRDVGKP